MRRLDNSNPVFVQKSCLQYIGYVLWTLISKWDWVAILVIRSSFFSPSLPKSSSKIDRWSAVGWTIAFKKPTFSRNFFQASARQIAKVWLKTTSSRWLTLFADLDGLSCRASSYAEMLAHNNTIAVNIVYAYSSLPLSSERRAAVRRPFMTRIRQRSSFPLKLFQESCSDWQLLH